MGAGPSSSSPGGGGSYSYDLGGSGLNSMYNTPIESAQRVERPKQGALGNSPIAVHHQGTLVTLQGGDQYLVHKGPGYAPDGSSQTVAVAARHMSSNWKAAGPQQTVSGAKMGDFIKAGGPGYVAGLDDCRHGQDRMAEVGKPKKK